ncbi:MAG: 23S rRNA (guanosine(2251)-2'-O)-methyltransferase RlmB [Chlorobi bacterium CHB2]|nr:23S rRNA (guanosine(2251)-2'-O)-methyltransferase RlmB [Chlorobi bacterium CHB2]
MRNFRQLTRDTALFINGRNAVLEALRSGKGLEKIFIMFGSEGEPVNEIRAEAKRLGVPCIVADRKKFLQMEKDIGLGTRSQGIIAQLREVEYEDIEAVVENAWIDGRAPLVAALDGITDPRNMGAIIRSAECAGIDGLFFGRRNSAIVNDVVMKTSAGAANHLPLDRVANLGDMLLRLKKSGLAIVGLDGSATASYTEHDFTAPTVIVVGSEGEGIGTRTKNLCDALISIPMRGQVTSLNASVAAGVVFFEAQRQRQAKK